MRILSYLMILISYIFTISSCNSTNPFVPNLTKPDLYKSYAYILSLTPHGAVLTVSAGNYVGDLALNGHYWESPDDAAYFGTHANYFYNHADEVISDSISYAFHAEEDGTAFNGTLQNPTQPQLQLPQYESGADYSFSWNSETQPMLYTLSIVLLGANEIIYQQLGGNDTHFTISKELLEQHDYPDLSINLGAVNYQSREGGYLAYVRRITGDIVSTSQEEK